MRLNDLYKTLYQSIDHVYGLDREFILDLTTEIPFIPGRYWREASILAMIPSNQVKDLRRAAKDKARSILLHRKYLALSKARGKNYSLDLLHDLLHEHDEIIWELTNI